MANQAETGYVRGGGGLMFDHHFRRIPVEGCHPLNSVLYRFGRSHLTLDGGGNNAASQRFCQKQNIARPGRGVADDPVRIHQAGHGQTVLQFFILDRVATHQADSRFPQNTLPAGQHFTQNLTRHGADWKEDQVHGGYRSAPHRIYVGDRIGGGNPAKGIGIVNQRGDDIGRLHQGALRRYPVNTGVIAGFRTYQQIFVIECKKPVQGLSQA